MIITTSSTCNRELYVNRKIRFLLSRLALLFFYSILLGYDRVYFRTVLVYIKKNYQLIAKTQCS